MELKERLHVKDVWGNLTEKSFLDILTKDRNKEIVIDIENNIGKPPFSGNVQVETTPQMFFYWLEVGLSRSIISYRRSDGDDVDYCSDNVNAWTRRQVPDNKRRHEPVHLTMLTVRGHADEWPSSLEKRDNYPKLVAPFAQEVNKVDHFHLSWNYRASLDCKIDVKNGNAILPKGSGMLALEGSPLVKHTLDDIDSLRKDLLHIYTAMEKIPTDYTRYTKPRISVGNNNHVF